MKNKAVDVVCLGLVAAMFGTVAVLNLFQPNRPTESEMEQRTLAKMPEFSLKALADGSFFAGTSSFVSDTFIGRDSLVGLSRKMDTLLGIDYSVGGENAGFVLLDNATGANADDEEAASAAADLIAAAFEGLLNTDTSDDTADTEDTENDSPAVTAPVVDNIIHDEAEVGAEDVTISEIEHEAESEVDSAEEPDTEASTDTDTDTDTENSGEPAGEPENEPEIPAGVDMEGNAGTDSVEKTDGTTPAEEEKKDTSPVVRAIHLSKSSIKLTVGSGAVVYATVESDTETGAKVKWSVSDKNIATISINPNGGIDVKGVSEGNCTLTCSAGEGDTLVKQQCEVSVQQVVTLTNSDETLNADFLPDGLFIYGDAVYTQAYYSETNAKNYAQTAAYYKTLFGENTRVSMVVAPVSAMVIDNPTVTSKIPDQKDILDKMAALTDPSVNFVDAYSEMYEHRDEYLFFKSDHHWTARGAYYAYSAFAKSIGLEPTPLDGFDYSIMNDSYSGSMYNYTYDSRVKNFTDKIEAFFPRKSLTMTVTGINGATYNYDTCIVSTNKTYVTFIAGDNPYTVINVPDNPQDMNVLVLKDSFGNAFVPFLCEHYGNIIVVDTRHTSMNVYEQLKDYGLTDIIFVNNIQAANSSSWYSLYMKAVGVNIGGR